MVKILVLIPARSGSKGIPNKNIKDFCGKPLLAWSIEQASKSKYILFGSLWQRNLFFNCFRRTLF